MLDLDEAQQLQEAASGVNTPQEEKSIDDILVNFAKNHPPLAYDQQQPGGLLAMPVIISQRRPQSHHRGFVRGYAPIRMLVLIKLHGSNSLECVLVKRENDNEIPNSTKALQAKR